MNDTPYSAEESAKPRQHRGLRVAGGLVLAAVLAGAFMGYLSPEMTLQWENLMALCGF